MRVLSSTYELCGDIEPMAGPAVQLRTLSVKARMCAPPHCAELLGKFGPQRAIGVVR